MNSDKDKKAEYDRAYYLVHKDRVAALGRAYYLANRDEVILQQRAYRLANHDKVTAHDRSRYIDRKDRTSEYSRAWCLANPDKVAAYGRAWRGANPAMVCAKGKLRRARKLGAGGSITLDQWKAIQSAYEWRCAYCGKKPAKLTQDHVIPLSRGGSHTPANIVPACTSCNSSKGARLPTKVPAKRLLI